MTTLYDLLGVNADATMDEIKRAYRKAAMKWHPDRNAGSEDAARAAFQEIKDAYAILSDLEQRRIYDEVYAEHMRGWEAHRQREEREQAERDAAAQAAAQAAYAENVAVAMRFADAGRNRDVLFGVLLGRGCEEGLAAQIADSVAALHVSRQAASAPAEEPEAPMNPHGKREKEQKREKDEKGEKEQETAGASSSASQHPAGPLGSLWFQFLNGLRL